MSEVPESFARTVGAVAATAVVGVWCCAGSAHADPVALTPADVGACGAFSVINDLVHESMVPERGPGGASSRTYDLVGLANALNNVEKRGMSAGVDDDLTAYVYALTTVGAAIN